MSKIQTNIKNNHANQEGNHHFLIRLHNLCFCVESDLITRSFVLNL